MTALKTTFGAATLAGQITLQPNWSLFTPEKEESPEGTYHGGIMSPRSASSWKTRRMEELAKKRSAVPHMKYGTHGSLQKHPSSPNRFGPFSVDPSSDGIERSHLSEKDPRTENGIERTIGLNPQNFVQRKSGSVFLLRYACLVNFKRKPKGKPQPCCVSFGGGSTKRDTPKSPVFSNYGALCGAAGARPPRDHGFHRIKLLSRENKRFEANWCRHP